jgi:hypothetical protein
MASKLYFITYFLSIKSKSILTMVFFPGFYFGRWFGLGCVVLVCARESIVLCSKSLCQTGCAGANIHSQDAFLL